MRPREQEPAHVGLSLVGAATTSYIRRQALIAGDRGVPGERRVVAVARGDDAAGPAHASHLAERADRILQVLEHLVRVHDVERVVVDVERVQIGGAELGVGRPLAFALGERGFDRGGRDIDSEHGRRRDPCGQVERDGAGPAADVENRHAGNEMRNEIRGRVLDGPPAVRAQHRLVMAVRVPGRLRRGHAA